MTILTIAQLKTQVGQLFADNSSEDVTPADMRTMLVNLIDSFEDIIEDVEDEIPDDARESEDENRLAFLPVRRINLVRPVNDLTLLATGFTGWEDKTIILFSQGPQFDEDDTTASLTRYQDLFATAWTVFVEQLLVRPAISAGSLVQPGSSGLTAKAPWIKLDNVYDHRGSSSTANAVVDIYLARTATNELLVAIDSASIAGPLHGGWPFRVTAL